MSEENRNPAATYQPEPIKPPPLYAWPPKPLAALKWLTVDLMLPWGVFWIMTAIVCWQFFTPNMARMQNLEPGWIAPDLDTQCRVTNPDRRWSALVVLHQKSAGQRHQIHHEMACEG